MIGTKEAQSRRYSSGLGKAMLVWWTMMGKKKIQSSMFDMIGSRYLLNLYTSMPESRQLDLQV